MKYEQPTFTVPVANGKLTQEEYEVAVGLRCPDCGSEDKWFVSYPCSLDRGTVNEWHTRKERAAEVDFWESEQ